MGVKGKKKRERERLLREQEEQQERGEGSDDGGPDNEGDEEDQEPQKMKLSEYFHLRDAEVMEQMKEEHKNRRETTTLGSKKKQHRTEEAKNSSDQNQHHQHDDGLLQSNEKSRKNAGSLFFDAETDEFDKLPRAPPTHAPFNHPVLGLRPELVAALSLEGFTSMTPIQERTIPIALKGNSILGQAKTGSGKTLAFLVPMLQCTYHQMITSPELFVGLILAPTKELCIQIHNVTKAVCQHFPKIATAAATTTTTRHGGQQQQQQLTPITVRSELITGGTKVNEERRRLQRANIVVGTPGRVKDHITNSKDNWSYRTASFLILDEADKMLADGFAKVLDGILSALPEQKQTLLFSATNSKSVRELARLSFKPLFPPLFVDTKGDAPRPLVEASSAVAAAGAPPVPQAYLALSTATATTTATTDAKEAKGKQKKKRNEEDGGDEAAAASGGAAADEEILPSKIRQLCHIVRQSHKLEELYVFVKHTCMHKKVMIFCSTVASVMFHCMMMGAIGFHDHVLMLHGKMKHRQRVATFQSFLEWPTGVLFCTDVAARGLDIPRVDWILQYDPPLDPTEYIHRIGRTARAGAAGNSLIFLASNERGFIQYLRKFGIQMHQYERPQQLPDIHFKLEHILELDPVVAKAAQAAVRAFVHAYQSHILKDTFSVHDLDLEQVAHSFALTSVPSISLPKSTEEDKTKDYVKGKLKSLNKRRVMAEKQYDQEKTRPQWSSDGLFVGVRKPHA